MELTVNDSKMSEMVRFINNLSVPKFKVVTENMWSDHMLP